MNPIPKPTLKTMKPFLTLLLTFLLSAPLSAQDRQHSHDEHLSILIGHYLEMKEALANDDFDTAKSALEKLTKEASENEEMNHHPDHSEMHIEHHSQMLKALETASSATSIAQLRDSFNEISEQLIVAVRNQSPDQQLFIQFCPMAKNGEGARWLSDKEEIRNPYYGAMMLACGRTVEEL